MIRQQCVDAQILDLLFGCLAVLTHRNPNSVDVKSYQFLFPPTLFGCPPSTNAPKQSNKYYVSAADGSMKQQPQYWAKGTGFGTGSMQSGWNMEQSFLRRNFEEQNCCAILQVSNLFNVIGKEVHNLGVFVRKRKFLFCIDLSKTHLNQSFYKFFQFFCVKNIIQFTLTFIPGFGCFYCWN